MSQAALLILLHHNAVQIVRLQPQILLDTNATLQLEIAIMSQAVLLILHHQVAAETVQLQPQTLLDTNATLQLEVAIMSLAVLLILHHQVAAETVQLQPHLALAETPVLLVKETITMILAVMKFALEQKDVVNVNVSLGGVVLMELERELVEMNPQIVIGQQKQVGVVLRVV
jgi:hypothetical protein